MKEYKIEWSNKARIDLQNHFSFILNVSYESAETFIKNMHQSISSLKLLPQRFPLFQMTNIISTIEFRKLVVDGRYIVIYAVYSDSIKIYRILDARKKFDTLID